MGHDQKNEAGFGLWTLRYVVILSLAEFFQIFREIKTYVVLKN